MSRVSRSKAVPKQTAKPVKANAYADQGDLRQEIDNLVADPERWLNTPNDRFGGRPPLALIGTEEEHLLREWVGAVKYGLLS